jgi:hypothetical protein
MTQLKFCLKYKLLLEDVIRNTNIKPCTLAEYISNNSTYILLQVQTSVGGCHQEHSREPRGQGQPEGGLDTDRGRGLAHQRAAEGAREQVRLGSV